MNFYNHESELFLCTWEINLYQKKTPPLNSLLKALTPIICHACRSYCFVWSVNLDAFFISFSFQSYFYRAMLVKEFVTTQNGRIPKNSFEYFDWLLQSDCSFRIYIVNCLTFLIKMLFSLHLPGIAHIAHITRIQRCCFEVLCFVILTANRSVAICSDPSRSFWST